MIYYILDNDEIVLFDTDKKRLQDTLPFRPELADKEMQETEREIVMLDNRYVFADEHIDELLIQAKEKKLAELAEATALFENNLNKDMYFTSSLGFKVNGDRRTRSNIEDLIAFTQTFPVAYRDYDNTMRIVTENELRTMLVEHITNGNNLYRTKWLLESQIQECTTIEAVNAIEVKFEMMDFRK